jgi:serine protease inhibitor
MEVKGARGQVKVFRADRPFLFVIRDRESGAILFLGPVSLVTTAVTATAAPPT